MSLKTETFSFCKSIIESELKGEVLDVVKSLNQNTSGNSFGYYAGRMRLQFASFLQVEAKVDEVEKSGTPLGIKHLEKSELDLFTALHEEVLYLNSLCLQDFDEYIQAAVSPYSYFGHYKRVNKLEFKYLPKDKIDTLVTEFRKLETLKDLLDSLKLAESIPGFEKKNLHVAMAVFLNEFNQANYDFVPPVSGDLLLKNYNQFEYNLLLLNLTLCVVLHQITNLNQLIYQAFLKSNLTAVTEENIISIIGETHNIMGEFTKVEIQPIGMDEIMTNPADICLLKYQDRERQVDNLCRVNSTSLNMGGDTGTVVTWDVSRVDDYLNSYPRLLPTFKTKRPNV